MLAYGATAYADLVLRLGNGGEPETLDPHRYNLRLEETILSDLFLGLTTFDPHGKPMPGAAERWEVSEDGKTWTFIYARASSGRMARRSRQRTFSIRCAAL